MTHRLRGDTSASSDPVVRAAAKSDRRSFAFGTRIKVESGRRRLRKRSTLFRILTPTLYLQRALISHWAAAKSVKHCAAPFLSHHWRWVRHRGSNRCHYPLNWLGHASTFPSCLTSPYYNSLSSHYCHVVHVLCTYIIARHKNIECIECAQSQVVETNADLFRRNQLCLHRRFGRLALIAFLCVYSLSWRKWTLCSTSDGRISFVTSLLTGVGTIHWREEGRVEDVRSVGICSTTVKRNTVKRNTVQILCNVGDKTFDGRFISINISLCNKLHLTVHCVSCYLLHILLKTTFSFRNYPFHFNWMGAQRKTLKRIKIGIAGEKQQDQDQDCRWDQRLTR